MSLCCQSSVDYWVSYPIVKWIPTAFISYIPILTHAYSTPITTHITRHNVVYIACNVSEIMTSFPMWRTFVELFAGSYEYGQAYQFPSDLTLLSHAVMLCTYIYIQATFRSGASGEASRTCRSAYPIVQEVQVNDAGRRWRSVDVQVCTCNLCICMTYNFPVKQNEKKFVCLQGWGSGICYQVYTVYTSVFDRPAMYMLHRNQCIYLVKGVGSYLNQSLLWNFRAMLLCINVFSSCDCCFICYLM